MGGDGGRGHGRGKARLPQLGLVRFVSVFGVDMVEKWMVI